MLWTSDCNFPDEALKALTMQFDPHWCNSDKSPSHIMLTEKRIPSIQDWGLKFYSNISVCSRFWRFCICIPDIEVFSCWTILISRRKRLCGWTRNSGCGSLMFFLKRNLSKVNDTILVLGIQMENSVFHILAEFFLIADQHWHMHNDPWPWTMNGLKGQLLEQRDVELDEGYNICF